MDGRELAVSVLHVTKTYKIYRKAYHRVLQVFFPRIPNKSFSAVRNVSFNVPKGETLGLVGVNGSGKSTLLKMITGVTTPTEGTIRADGRIVAMLELTSGFDGELTGMENIYLKAAVMNIPKKEVERRLPMIRAFADIGEYIDQPVRTYSSGMKSRLGFAISVHVDPDILVVDEVLAVGDEAFRLKCLQKMEEFRKQGKTILFVSHSLFTIKAFCTSAIWMHKGELKAQGNTGSVVQAYEAFLKEQKRKDGGDRGNMQHGQMTLWKKQILFRSIGPDW